jgi:hypothetical protein
VNRRGSMQGNSESPPDERSVPAVAHGGRTERVRAWRRRVLLRRGARKRAVMGSDADSCSLAMLDETGVVVSWYGDISRRRDSIEHVVGRHVSQFYVPEEVASKQPLRDLHRATTDGSNTLQGWRCQADGTIFWGIIVIEALMLRDGRLQGFSYVTRACDGPADVPLTQRVNAPHDEDNSVSPLAWSAQSHSADTMRFATLGVSSSDTADMVALRFLPVRDRMIGSRASARRRRLFRLVSVLRSQDASRQR